MNPGNNSQPFNTARSYPYPVYPVPTKKTGKGKKIAAGIAGGLAFMVVVGALAPDKDEPTAKATEPAAATNAQSASPAAPAAAPSTVAAPAPVAEPADPETAYLAAVKNTELAKISSDDELISNAHNICGAYELADASLIRMSKSVYGPTMTRAAIKYFCPTMTY